MVCYRDLQKNLVLENFDMGGSPPSDGVRQYIWHLEMSTQRETSVSGLHHGYRGHLATQNLT